MRPSRSVCPPRPRYAAALLVAAVLILLAGGVAGPAQAAAARQPHAGTPWVVTVGDSYISGEAGRWAGNTNTGEQHIDALGPTAYFDAPTGEQIPRCHRSKAAEAFIDAGVSGLTLACSGAKTSTFVNGSGDFKPGLDFYSDSAGRLGQAAMLRHVASTHDVRLVVVSIGGNNFNFAAIIQACVMDFLFSSDLAPHYCSHDASVTANFTPANVAAQTAAIRDGILDVRRAMALAGRPDRSYTILVQDYPSPIPPAAGFRYGQSGYTRQVRGGCGVWDVDADWATTTALPAIDHAVQAGAAATGLRNLRTLELATAFSGHRLCESSVGLLEERGLRDWWDPGAVDQTEWIDQIRTLTTVGTDYAVQESLHPDYWGQLALRSCVRQAYDRGRPRGGTCTIAGPGLTARGEPDMALR
jgi:hypothetical protein